MKLGRRIKTIGGGQSCTVELYKSSKNNFTALKILGSKKVAKNEYDNVKYLQDECSEDSIRYNSRQFIMEVRSIKNVFSLSSLARVTELVIPYYPVTLLEFLKTDPSLEIKELLFKQILLGINYMHNNNICHRDLKIDNICISENGVIKIIDFGSSIRVCNHKSPLEFDCIGIHGTDPFISPDASDNLKYNGQKNDLWALGIILYILVNSEISRHQMKSSSMDYCSSFYLSPSSSSSSVYNRGTNSRNRMILYPWLNLKDTKYLAYKIFQEEFEKRLVDKNLTYLNFINVSENPEVFDDELIEEFVRVVLNVENLEERSKNKLKFLLQAYANNNKTISLRFQQEYSKSTIVMGFCNLLQVIPVKYRLLLSLLLALNPKLRCESTQESFFEAFLEKSWLKDVGEFPDLAESKNFNKVIGTVNQIFEKKLRKLKAD